MKGIKLILIGVFLSAALPVLAQDEIISMPRFRLGIEAGITGIFDAETNKHENLRENRSYYYDYYDRDYYCGFVLPEQNLSLYYFGVKPEYSVTKRFAVAAGLRFTFNSDALSSDRDYFLWKTSESDGNTNYVKIRNISQDNIFVGVPLELKFFPNEKDYIVRHYFILGTVMNFLVSSKSEISYENREMEKYNSLISGQIKKPNKFHDYMYAGFGLKFGRTNHPFGNLEIHFPVYMLDNERISSFKNVRESLGIGVRTTLNIPIFKNRKLQYKINND